MGLGSLIIHHIQLTHRIRGETNHSIQHKHISPSQYASNKPKPHSLSHVESTEGRKTLFLWWFMQQMMRKNRSGVYNPSIAEKMETPSFLYKDFQRSGLQNILMYSKVWALENHEHGSLEQLIRCKITSHQQIQEP